ncbi:hypothetical protein HYS03_01770 [Candidatus Woesebacteria bacterium]|nr:hypothetical protein [Candidatus Woesebacteria bacterium]QQG47900.1 MAG: hypothetical protein HY044_02335 [Candidatus Woesebacteria bacterium]
MKRLFILTTALVIISIAGGIYFKDYYWKKYSFQGCGPNLSDYQYSIELPGQWNTKKRDLGSELLTKNSVYYDLTKNNMTFTISCTTQGVGGDICDTQYRKTFNVGNQIGEACYGKINGIWKMGVLNLPRNLSNNTVIAFWAEDIEPDLLSKIFSTFQLNSKQ